MTQLIAQRPNADTFAEYAANPDAFLSIKGVPPEIAYRAGFAVQAAMAVIGIAVYASIPDVKPRG